MMEVAIASAFPLFDWTGTQKKSISKFMAVSFVSE